MTRTSVLFAIPTTNSADHIGQTLTHLFGEISSLPDDYEATLVVCLNGADEQGATERAIQTAFERQRAASSRIALDLVRLLPAGKSRAVNALVGEARRRGCAVIHLFDDDVRLGPGSVAPNLRAVTAAKGLTLVGSRFCAGEHSLKELLAKQPPWHAMQAWLLHRTFRTPFDPVAEVFPFCSAQSLCMLTVDFPSLPEEDAGITDDAYLNYYVVARGGTVHKVAASTVQFEVAATYAEWNHQQTRLFLGLLATLDAFPVERARIEDAFAWPYAYNRGSRRLPRLRTFLGQPFLLPYWLCRHQLTRRVERLWREGETVGWGTAASTKRVSDVPSRDVASQSGLQSSPPAQP